METLKQFFEYYKPYKWLFIIDFGCAIIAGLLELIFPVAVNNVIDILLPQGDWNIIIWACIGLLLLYVFTAFLQFVVTYWGHMLGINIETDMRKESFQHVQKLSFRYFDNNKTGHLVSRMTNDLMDIGEIAHHGPEDLFIAVMTLIGAFGIMLSINVEFAIMTFILVPALVILSIYISKKMSVAFRRMFGDIADFNARVENNVSGIRVVKAFANEEFEMSRFEVNNGRFRTTKLSAYKIMAWNSSISHLLMKLISLFVLGGGTYFVIEGEMTFGEFTAFILLSNVFLTPIKQINQIFETFPKGIAGFKRYQELIGTEPEVKEREEAIDLVNTLGDIEYKDVVFSYGEKGNVLDKINFNIKSGETIALVGPSGAGKTTICSLLPRFYDIEDGSIKIDGIDIKELTLSSLRKNIGIVQQDVFLFDGTIRENIDYGRLGSTEEEIWEAARRAQLEETIRSMPDGMDTVIGERGVKLSGGQKQRISIARMFLKNPSILILDEATSALDTETESAIQESLSELAKGRTTLIIAHRLATIKNANRIFVITENGVEEEGTHKELLEIGGAYSRLHHAQFQQ